MGWRSWFTSWFQYGLQTFWSSQRSLRRQSLGFAVAPSKLSHQLADGVDHAPDLVLADQIGRRHRERIAGRAVQLALVDRRFEQVQRTQARLAGDRFQLDRRRQPGVADVEDAGFALER